MDLAPLSSLQESQKETSAQVKENNEDIDFLFEDIGALRRRNIKLEAYTRRENVRILNVEEEEDENTEELVRSVFVANLKISVDKVNDIRLEQVRRISTNNYSLRAPSITSDKKEKIARQTTTQNMPLISERNKVITIFLLA